MTEANEAKRDGATLQPNSGRGKHKKGDAVLNDYLLIDYKEFSKSFTITPAVWGKICTDAIGQGLQPALKIIMGQPDKPKVRMFVVSEDTLLELLEFKWMYEGLCD